MRFCSPWNTSGSSSSRRLRDAFLCRNWWLLCVLRRVIFPVPVILNRFAAVLLVLIFGIALLLRRGRLWNQDHDHHASIQRRDPLNGPEIRHRFRELFQLLPAQLGVRDLARLEHAGDLDLVALAEELPRLDDAGLQVVLRNSRTDLYTLNFLLLALLVLALLPFQVLMLAIVDDLAHRRLGRRRNHDEVKPLLAGDAQSLPALENAQLGAIGVDDAYVAKT